MSEIAKELQISAGSIENVVHEHGCVIGRAWDLRFTGRGFESWLGVIALCQVVYLCASVTMQYNLVPVKGVISLAGKVTVGLVESTSNGLPPARVYD